MAVRAPAATHGRDRAHGSRCLGRDGPCGQNWGLRGPDPGEAVASPTPLRPRWAEPAEDSEDDEEEEEEVEDKDPPKKLKKKVPKEPPAGEGREKKLKAKGERPGGGSIPAPLSLARVLSPSLSQEAQGAGGSGPSPPPHILSPLLSPSSLFSVPLPVHPSRRQE